MLLFAELNFWKVFLPFDFSCGRVCCLDYTVYWCCQVTLLEQNSPEFLEMFFFGVARFTPKRKRTLTYRSPRKWLEQICSWPINQPPPQKSSPHSRNSRGPLWNPYKNPRRFPFNPRRSTISEALVDLGGSSHLGYVANNHGDRKSPKDRVGLVVNGRTLWLINGGYCTNHF